MSSAPWATTAAAKPFGFRVTIERTVKGSRENHTFKAKTAQRSLAVKQAEYKQGFERLVSAEPLTKQEWERDLTPRAQRITTGAAR